MFISLKRLLCLFSIVLITSSCQSNNKELKFNDKPISSVESKNENIIIHFTDRSTISFSLKELETSLKKKEISAKTYQEIFQKVKDEKRKTKQLVIANNAQKEKSKTFNINGMNATSVEFKNGKFIFNLADHTEKVFSQEEVDYMVQLSIITEETYLMCFQKKQEEKITHSQDSTYSVLFTEK